MRTFLVFFVLAWLAGIGCGVYGVSVIPIMFIGLMMAYAAFALKLSIQIFVTVLSLLLLGYVYGQPPIKDSHTCTLPNAAVTGVIRQSIIKSDKTEYLFDANDGCTFLVYAPRFPEYLSGQHLQISGGTLQSPEQVDAEYEGYAQYLKRKNIDAAWHRPSIKVIDNGASPMALWRLQVRKMVQDVFIEPDASLISAMLFAEQGTIPEQFVQQFRNTGVTHVLAISGLNMSLIAGTIYLLLIFVPLPKVIRAVIASAIVWVYILSIGAPTSVVRAGIFWTIALLSWHWQVLISLPTVILLTALVMMSIYPPISSDVGFQLSVTAIIGIGLMFFITQPIRLKGRGVRVLWSSAMISLGAVLTTWPLIAYHFGTVSFVSVIANILIVPVVAPLIFLGVATLLLSPFTILGAEFLSFGVHLLIHWMDVITLFLGGLPGAVLNDVSISETAMLIYYLLLVVAAILIITLQGRSWRQIWQ